jgi:hypothetical protein
MKRRITPEQLAELTAEQKDRLREWWKPEIGDCYYYGFEDMFAVVTPENLTAVMFTKKNSTKTLPLLDIGQCIDLLEWKDECFNIVKKIDLEGWGYEIQLRLTKYYKFATGELIDALWEAVKSVL